MRLWPRGGLWRDSDFLRLWGAQTVSQFGSQVSAIALPFVAIVALDASAFSVAALGAVEMLPFLLIALPAGVWVDRLPRRPILIAGDLGRALALASIPAAWALDVLTIWQLYVVGFVVGVFTVFFDVAYQSYLPSLVSRGRLVDGNSKLEFSRSAAQVGGPGMGGLLVGAITAPYAVLVDAVSFLWSGLLAAAHPGSRGADRPDGGSEHAPRGRRGRPLHPRRSPLAGDHALRVDGQLLLGGRVLDPPRVRGAGASSLRRHDRRDLRARQHRVADRGDAQRTRGEAARDRPDDRG